MFINTFSVFTIVAFIVPVMIVSFKAHRLLFNFDYATLEEDDTGDINFGFVFQAETIQFLFIGLTFCVLSVIEAKFNKLDLRVVYKSNSKMEICSRFIIFFWSIFCLLSSVTILPTAGNCESNDICTCKYDINKSKYGCNPNLTCYK